MSTYLEALDFWEAVKEEYEVESLPKNPTMTQITIHKEKKTTKAKAKICVLHAVSSTIFTRIMNVKSAKAFGITSKKNMREMKEPKTCRYST